jgi:hypothetical protein
VVRNKLLLSDADRSLCSDALAEQFSLGRIDKTDLDRRTDLLYAAQTRGELREVFDGLRAPVLDKPPARSEGIPRWRMTVFKILSVLSVPFLLLGVSMMWAHVNLTIFITGAFCFVGALAWNYFAWFWASRGHKAR